MDFTGLKKHKGHNEFQMKCAHPVMTQIKDMSESANFQGKDSQEYKARKQSITHTLEKTDQLHHRKDYSKIKMDEFCSQIDFRFGIPILMLDII